VAVVGTIEIDEEIEKADWAGQYVYRGKMDSNKPAPAAQQQQSSSDRLNIACWQPKRSYTVYTHHKSNQRFFKKKENYNIAKNQNLAPISQINEITAHQRIFRVVAECFHKVMTK
jgi:hypothetical protein